MAKKARLLRVKRSPRYEGEGRGRNEGEGETRLIKRRPPPSANGPTAQELHAGNCCANTTTFILQPLGKRHILFNQERCCASLPPSFFLLAKESRFGFVSARIWNARWSRSFRRSKRSCDGTLDCGRKMQEERERKRKISTKIIFRQFRNFVSIPRDRIDSRSPLQRHQWKMTRGALYRHSPPLLTVAVLRWT